MSSMVRARSSDTDLSTAKFFFFVMLLNASREYVRETHLTAHTHYLHYTTSPPLFWSSMHSAEEGFLFSASSLEKYDDRCLFHHIS